MWCNGRDYFDEKVNTENLLNTLKSKLLNALYSTDLTFPRITYVIVSQLPWITSNVPVGELLIHAELLQLPTKTHLLSKYVPATGVSEVKNVKMVIRVSNSVLQ